MLKIILCAGRSGSTTYLDYFTNSFINDDRGNKVYSIGEDTWAAVESADLSLLEIPQEHLTGNEYVVTAKLMPHGILPWHGPSATKDCVKSTNVMLDMFKYSNEIIYLKRNLQDQVKSYIKSTFNHALLHRPSTGQVEQYELTINGNEAFIKKHNESKSHMLVNIHSDIRGAILDVLFVEYVYRLYRKQHNIKIVKYEEFYVGDKLARYNEIRYSGDGEQWLTSAIQECYNSIMNNEDYVNLFRKYMGLEHI